LGKAKKNEELKFENHETYWLKNGNLQIVSLINAANKELIELSKKYPEATFKCEITHDGTFFHPIHLVNYKNGKRVEMGQKPNLQVGYPGTLDLRKLPVNVREKIDEAIRKLLNFDVVKHEDGTTWVEKSNTRITYEDIIDKYKIVIEKTNCLNIDVYKETCQPPKYEPVVNIKPIF
jgi:hypothetical protein